MRLAVKSFDEATGWIINQASQCLMLGWGMRFPHLDQISSGLHHPLSTEMSVLGPAIAHIARSHISTT